LILERLTNEKSGISHLSPRATGSVLLAYLDAIRVARQRRQPTVRLDVNVPDDCDALCIRDS
jgi:hypothetical protein